MPEALLPAAVAEVLVRLPGWSGDVYGLTKAWRFRDFSTAMSFMYGAIPAIEQLDHHPQWCNVYNHVSVTLHTHDAGGRVTELDVKLARLLDAEAAKHGF